MINIIKFIIKKYFSNRLIFMYLSLSKIEYFKKIMEKIKLRAFIFSLIPRKISSTFFDSFKKSGVDIKNIVSNTQIN